VTRWCRSQVVTAIDDTVALCWEKKHACGRWRFRFEHPEQAIWIQGDNAELRQVFVNLLHNAMHAMQGGRDRSVSRSKPATLRSCVIRVSDSGVWHTTRKPLAHLSCRSSVAAPMGKPGWGWAWRSAKALLTAVVAPSLSRANWAKIRFSPSRFRWHWAYPHSLPSTPS
jgi:hypothetical protein